jgi:hypothetical protein
MGARPTRLSNQAFGVGEQTNEVSGASDAAPETSTGEGPRIQKLLAPEFSWAAIRLVAILFDPETNLIFDRKPARGRARKL